MTDAADPSFPFPVEGRSQQEVAMIEAAVDLVRLVIAWYAARIFEGERSVPTDPAHLARLESALAACVVDEQRMPYAKSDEVARVAEAYRRRYRVLGSS
jgi:hypothetical protein